MTFFRWALNNQQSINQYSIINYVIYVSKVSSQIKNTNLTNRLEGFHNIKAFDCWPYVTYWGKSIVFMLEQF